MIVLMDYIKCLAHKKIGDTSNFIKISRDYTKTLVAKSTILHQWYTLYMILLFFKPNMLINGTGRQCY